MIQSCLCETDYNYTSCVYINSMEYSPFAASMHKREFSLIIRPKGSLRFQFSIYQT